MSVGTAELAPPNEGGDDRDPAVMQARLEEMLDDNYQSFDAELDQLLKDAADEQAGIVSNKEATTPEKGIPEPIEFTETEVGQKGIHRRYRQAGLGIHAGYLSLSRQMPREVRILADGTKEFVLGDTDTTATNTYARTMSVFGTGPVSKPRRKN